MMHLLESFGAFVNKVLIWIAGFSLFALLIFTVADMTLRALGMQVAGSYEIIGWLAAASMALALGSVQQHRGHVSVKLLERHFGPRMKACVDLFNCALSLALFVAVTWYVVRYAGILRMTGSLSETLRVVVYPWVYVVAVGCGGLALTLLIDVIRAAATVIAPPREA